MGNFTFIYNYGYNLACSSANSHGYWHCKTDYHCFNYTDKACGLFNGSIEDYEEYCKQQEIENKKKDLLAQKEALLEALQEVDKQLEQRVC